MAKLLVKDSKTGNTRSMTQKSYDAAGQKRGFKIVGKEAETGQKSEIQQHMDRLRAEKEAKEATKAVIEPEAPEDETAAPEVKERKKPGPKPKNPEA